MQLAVTHSGKFHADDVLSWSFIQYFCPNTYTLVRTRDEHIFAKADIIFDVGGIFEPKNCKFDHHQHEYTGRYSSAGMLLEWLCSTQFISIDLYQFLKDELVDYVDDVDNGRIKPKQGIPDFTTMVDCYNHGCSTLEEYDAAFIKASNMSQDIIHGLCIKHKIFQENILIVKTEMDAAIEQKRNFLFFSNYVSWKEAYFSIASEHPTEFVIHPSLQGNWTTVAIPPNLNSFDQKTSLPEHWAGYMNEKLVAITGKSSAIFCHKNRFICAFSNLEEMLESLIQENLITCPNIKEWLEKNIS